MKYLSDFLEKQCSSELMALYCLSRNPTKEITESYAAYRNLKPFMDYKNPEKTYFFVGDGSLCMTGALFAFLTKGLCYSIDPIANIEKIKRWGMKQGVRNFYVFKERIQDSVWIQTLPKTGVPATIVLVHAHVSIPDVIKQIPNWDYIYTNPCCHPKKQKLSIQQQASLNISVVAHGDDWEILSDKKEIVIYKNNKEV